MTQPLSFLPPGLAARPPFLLSRIYEEVLGVQKPESAYRNHFVAFIHQGITLGLLDARLGELALGYLSEALVPERDRLFDAADLEMLTARYLLRDHTQHLMELPQWFWLRIALGLSLEEAQPEAHALSLYETLSRLQPPEAARSLAAAGTPGQGHVYLLDPALRRMLHVPVEDKQGTEPMLTPQRASFTNLTIQQSEMWNLYEQAKSIYWTPETTDLSSERASWDTELNDHERHFIKHILALLTLSEGFVNENLALNFMREVQYPEARSFYGFQFMMENIHAETYVRLLNLYLQDATEKNHLFRALETLPGVQRKADWARRWIEQGSFAERLVAFAAIESVFFAGSFCALRWLRQRGVLPGLGAYNELIARDEALHTAFACLLYSQLQEQLAPALLQTMITEAVLIEKALITQELSVEHIGLNTQDMLQYIEFEADCLLRALGAPAVYQVSQPFDFMQPLAQMGPSLQMAPSA
ncbi:MAG: ribonucleotide-diphosphate reductase subunit beta [Candidatus Sericytochromatia bacterium]